MRGGYLHGDEIQGRVFDRKLVQLLAPYVRRRLGTCLLAVVLVLLSTGLVLAGPYLIRIAIDDAILVGKPRLLWILAGTYLGLQLARFGLGAWTSYLLQKLGLLISFDLRNDLFEHVQTLPVSFFDRNPVGRLVTRLTNDVEAVTELFRGGLVRAISDLLLILGISGMLLVLDWRLGLVILAVLPALMLAVRWFARKLRLAFRNVREKLARINAFLAENIGGMGVIQLFGREEMHRQQFHQVTEDHFHAQYRSMKNWAFFSSTIVIFAGAALALVLEIGGLRVLGGAITLGTFIAFTEYVRQLFEPIRGITERYNEFLSAMASLERIHGLWERKPESTEEEATTLPRPRGAIEFQDVHFEYVPGEPVLQGVSFRIQPGETVAIVGATGAGKTTLLNILNKFYPIQSGRVLIDGLDLAGIDRDSLRRHIGVIPQEITLFAGPLRDNVTLWNQEISPERVEEITRLLKADRFIHRLPRGFDTTIEEAGANLSVGERQLISFARVLAYDPAILILDEATSNIDSETERLVQEAVQKVTTGRTSIVVAHRLSTIRDASKILVLHKGHLVEEGTHQELLAKKGVYAKLHELQFAKG